MHALIRFQICWAIFQESIEEEVVVVIATRERKPERMEEEPIEEEYLDQEELKEMEMEEEEPKKEKEL